MSKRDLPEETVASFSGAGSAFAASPEDNEYESKRRKPDVTVRKCDALNCDKQAVGATGRCKVREARGS
jgi:hypothetical protein